MKYRITHKTSYSYSEPASLSQNELYLHPRKTGSQQPIQSRLHIEPTPQYLQQRTDYFGNIADVFMIQQSHENLAITASSIVSITPEETPLPEATPSWESTVKRLTEHRHWAELEAYQFVFASPLVSISPKIKEYARISFTDGTSVLSSAVDLMRRIYTEFTYDKSATSVDTAVEHVLANRKGVCQDFAHLAISCLRSMGLAARYVSGYLKTQPPPGKPKLIGADASHAWLSLFVPDFGWVDLDPTNNLIPSKSHITLAWGRDYGDVTPVKGVVLGGGTHSLSVMVDVADA